jgi:hypothetical protein
MKLLDVLFGRKQPPPVEQKPLMTREEIMNYPADMPFDEWIAGDINEYDIIQRYFPDCSFNAQEVYFTESRIRNIKAAIIYRRKEILPSHPALENRYIFKSTIAEASGKLLLPNFPIVYDRSGIRFAGEWIHNDISASISLLDKDEKKVLDVWRNEWWILRGPWIEKIIWILNEMDEEVAIKKEKRKIDRDALIEEMKVIHALNPGGARE